MTEEQRLSVVMPKNNRRKLPPDQPPPRFPEQAGTFNFEPSSVNLAGRLDTLENKTLYLVDIGFGGGHNFLLEVQRWLGEHVPSLTTIVRRKPGHVFSDDYGDLWPEVREKGDAVILGVAG